MSNSTSSVAKPKSRRVLASVRILTWLAVALFLIAFALAPRGITVLWSGYLLLFGPVIIVDLAAVVGFITCCLMRQKISFAYLLMSLAVMVGVWYVTWFELRLRWYEVFS
jgi:uncharacterized membrane protein